MVVIIIIEIIMAILVVVVLMVLIITVIIVIIILIMVVIMVIMVSMDDLSVFRNKIIRNSTQKISSRVLNSRNMMSVARTSYLLCALFRGVCRGGDFHF